MTGWKLNLKQAKPLFAKTIHGSRNESQPEKPNNADRKFFLQPLLVRVVTSIFSQVFRFHPIALAIAITSLGIIPVRAQSAKPAILVQNSPSDSGGSLIESSLFNAPDPPDGIGEPGNRVGGGKRGCLDVETQSPVSMPKRLTALVPVYPQSELVLGFTTKEHPSFLFYVPYASPILARFVVQDEPGKTVYETSVNLSETPGIVKISMPSTGAPLEMGKRYYWIFVLDCKIEETGIFTSGWIQRESLDSALNTQLETTTPQQRVALYAANGFWYEAIEDAAELHRTNSSRRYWGNMLRSVGLEELISEPIAECCNL